MIAYSLIGLSRKELAMAVTIEKCTCPHEYQDKKYGKGMRVHNKAPKVDKDKGRRCTVCGVSKNV